VCVFQTHESFGQKKENPNKVARKEIRKIKKGKNTDIVFSLHQLVEVLPNPKLKRSLKKSTIKILASNYTSSIAVSDNEIQMMLKQLSNDDVVKQFFTYQKITKKLQYRRELAEALKVNPIRGATPEDTNRLIERGGVIIGKRDQARDLAAEETYQKGKVIFDKAKNNREFKQAYDAFKLCGQIYPNYRDVSQLIAKAFNGARVDILILPISSTGTIDNSRAAAGITKQFKQYLQYSYRAKDPFIRISMNKVTMPNPDVTFKLIIQNITIKQAVIKPRSKYFEKVVKKDGKEVTLKATGTIYKKKKTCEIEGIYVMTFLNGDRETITKKFKGFYLWTHIYGKSAGDREALRGEFLSAIKELKDKPFPKKHIMIDNATDVFRQDITLFKRQLEATAKSMIR
jgi:hypothetical protein